MPIRDSSSATRSIAVSIGSLPRILATSASVLPVSGFNFSDLNATKQNFVRRTGRRDKDFPICRCRS